MLQSLCSLATGMKEKQSNTCRGLLVTTRQSRLSPIRAHSCLDKSTTALVGATYLFYHWVQTAQIHQVQVLHLNDSPQGVFSRGEFEQKVFGYYKRYMMWCTCFIHKNGLMDHREKKQCSGIISFLYAEMTVILLSPDYIPSLAYIFLRAMGQQKTRKEGKTLLKLRFWWDLGFQALRFHQTSVTHDAAKRWKKRWPCWHP